jgi:hypothetical protein
MLDSYFLVSDRLGFREWSLDDLPLARALWGNAIAGGADIALYVCVTVIALWPVTLVSRHPRQPEPTCPPSNITLTWHEDSLY